MVEGLERELQVGQGHLLNHGQLLARQRVRCNALDVVTAAAKRLPTPNRIYHARVLATAAVRLRQSTLQTAKRLAAAVTRALFDSVRQQAPDRCALGGSIQAIGACSRAACWRVPSGR